MRRRAQGTEDTRAGKIRARENQTRHVKHGRIRARTHAQGRLPAREPCTSKTHVHGQDAREERLTHREIISKRLFVTCKIL